MNLDPNSSFPVYPHPMLCNQPGPSSHNFYHYDPSLPLHNGNRIAPFHPCPLLPPAPEPSNYVHQPPPPMNLSPYPHVPLYHFVKDFELCYVVLPGNRYNGGRPFVESPMNIPPDVIAKFEYRYRGIGPSEFPPCAGLSPNAVPLEIRWIHNFNGVDYALIKYDNMVHRLTELTWVHQNLPHLWNGSLPMNPQPNNLNGGPQPFNQINAPMIDLGELQPVQPAQPIQPDPPIRRRSAKRKKPARSALQNPQRNLIPQPSASNIVNQLQNPVEPAPVIDPVQNDPPPAQRHNHMDRQIQHLLNAARERNERERLERIRQQQQHQRQQNLRPEERMFLQRVLWQNNNQEGQAEQQQHDDNYIPPDPFSAPSTCRSILKPKIICGKKLPQWFTPNTETNSTTDCARRVMTVEYGQGYEELEEPPAKQSRMEQ